MKYRSQRPALQTQQRGLLGSQQPSHGPELSSEEQSVDVLFQGGNLLKVFWTDRSLGLEKPLPSKPCHLVAVMREHATQLRPRAWLAISLSSAFCPLAASHPTPLPWKSNWLSTSPGTSYQFSNETGDSDHLSLAGRSPGTESSGKEDT